MLFWIKENAGDSMSAAQGSFGVKTRRPIKFDHRRMCGASDRGAPIGTMIHR
jgi:hypothetical protein